MHFVEKHLYFLAKHRLLSGRYSFVCVHLKKKSPSFHDLCSKITIYIKLWKLLQVHFLFDALKKKKQQIWSVDGQFKLHISITWNQICICRFSTINYFERDLFFCRVDDHRNAHDPISFVGYSIWQTASWSMNQYIDNFILEKKKGGN